MNFKGCKSLLISTFLVASMGAATAATIVRPATFPPVPESWNVSILGNTVEYSSPTNLKTQKTPKTVVRFTYSKRTNSKDAKAVISEYAKTNSCKTPKLQGKGFYTASCPNSGVDVVVIGEVSNMYTIELTGSYDKIAINLINTYVNSIINGKRTFDDRDIGEKVPSEDD